MSKSFRTFLMIAGATACFGAAPLAMSQFGAGGQTPDKTWGQTLQEWRDSARIARQYREAEGHARHERIEAQEVSDLNAAMNYRSKFSTCHQQATEHGLHFLRRMTFIHDCMHQS